MGTSGIEQILMAYLALIMLDKKWEGQQTMRKLYCVRA